MRARATTMLSLAVLAALTSCAGQEDGYTVAHRTQRNGSGSADLVLPDADKDRARAAIRDYAAGIEGAELYYVKVVQGEDAGRYVCRARWYRDPAAYAAHSGHTQRPTSWPYLAITCP
jgi:hypothetical protein